MEESIVTRRQQPQESFIHQVGANLATLTESYIKEQNQQQYLNEYIPKKNPNEKNRLRIATFNVHFWLKPDSIDRHDNQILSVIEKLEADIIVIQEFDDQSTLEDKVDARNVKRDCLVNMGYIYHTCDDIPDDFPFQTVIFSKYPLIYKKYYKLIYSGRLCIETKVQLLDITITLIGLHLDVWDDTEDTRQAELSQILNLLITQSVEPNHILLGDFNSIRRKDYTEEKWTSMVEHDKRRDVETVHKVTDRLESRGYVECFTKAGLPVPQCTTWNGRRIDFIYLSPAWQYGIGGCYIYHDASSDHLPVLCDFLIRK